MDMHTSLTIAHINSKGDSQSVLRHLKETAGIAKSMIISCGLGDTAYLAGLFHDLGKCSAQFQHYIQNPGSIAKGSVIHTFQGCKYILDTYHNSENSYIRLASELVAYAIGAHHGLFDIKGNVKETGFDYRRNKAGLDYDIAVNYFFSEIISLDETNNLVSHASKEIQNILEAVDSVFPKDSDYSFILGLLERLILSALIEGDRRDTAKFMNCAVFPSYPINMTKIWDKALSNVEARILQFPSDTPIEKARRKISDLCFAASEMPCGIYRLNVPTGGGKTLSSLRYALAHAKKFNKKHIIFTSPLLSILEQNAAVIHEFVNDDSIILEHHSNVVQEDFSQQELDERELYVQTWDVPIIITTMVQLLNTFFDGKTSSIRRFHSLAESILVIDEVQTVPVKMLSLFNLAIQFLSVVCHTTIVLCSATQPYLEITDHPVQISITDLVEYDERLWNIFKRTEIHPLPSVKKDSLASMINDLLNDSLSLLIICNTKSEAADLYRQLDNCEQKKYHLSAAMCVQHRRNTIKELKSTLKAGEKLICVSTQVIEAGVDISFQKVIRFTAGMDSIIQAAGRCNRNGESSHPQPVFVLDVMDENLSRLPDICRGKQSTIALLERFSRDQNSFNNSLESKDSIQYYYKKFYENTDEGYQDYPLNELSTTIFDLLSQNNKYSDLKANNDEEYFINQAFYTAGKEFKVFEENSHDIIVPYEEGLTYIQKLCSTRAIEDSEYRREILNLAKPFIVSVYEYQFQKLLTNHSIYPVCGNYSYALLEQYYDKNLGLLDEPYAQNYLEV